MQFPLRVEVSRWRRVVPPVMGGLALLAVIKPALTQQPLEPAVISGTVFEDRNENGVRDRWERGVDGVSVSDGKVTVETDVHGRYRLQMDTDRRLTDIVFITMPDRLRRAGRRRPDPALLPDPGRAVAGRAADPGLPSTAPAGDHEGRLQLRQPGRRSRPGRARPTIASASPTRSASSTSSPAVRPSSSWRAT